MGHIIQTKQESRISGGPQYYLHGLEPQTEAFLSKVGTCEVWLGTPYGIVMAGLMAVAKDKVLEGGRLRPGRVGHHRIQRQKARYSVENELKRWFCLPPNLDLYKLEFRERTYHSKITKKDALLLLPEGVQLGDKRRRKLPLDPQPLTFTTHHLSWLITEHLARLRRTAPDSLVWAGDQIGRVLNDHLARRIPDVGEEDILRVTGAMAKLGVQLGAYRRRGYDCFDSEFTFLDYPPYYCPVEIKKRSSGFDYQILKKATPERAAILCLQHDTRFVPPEVVDVIELRALHQHLSP